MDRVVGSIFSFKTLAWCWGGLLTGLGTGAVALQLTMAAPPLVLVQAAVEPAVVPPPAPVVPPPAVVASVPFQNHSLLAMLPPPAVRPVERSVRPVLRASAPLPLPPQPPAPRMVHLEPRRVERVYAAEPAYPPPGWARMAPYEAEYARVRPYAYAAPPSYYGW